MAAVLLIAAVGWAFGSAHGPVSGHGVAQQSRWRAQPVESAPNVGDVSAAVQKVVPGLVDVNTELGMQNGAGAGTGIVLTSDGDVLTNNHVVEGATRIAVTDLGNGRTYPATVVGYDRTEDVAVLHLSNASGLTTAPLGDSNSVAVGDVVAGVGNAGGVGGAPSVAPGRVTALNQSITAADDATGSSEQLTGLIQVAANVQPGDSGGPLVGTAGKVVGMDTAATQNYRFGPRGTGGGGFAIPIDEAKTLAHQIEARKSSDTVHIGPTAMLGVTVSDGNGSGAVVRGVVAGGPADRAGLSAGDVVTSVDGQSVDSATALTELLDRHHPGDRVSVGLTDASGASRSVSVQLAQGPVG